MASPKCFIAESASPRTVRKALTRAAGMGSEQVVVMMGLGIAELMALQAASALNTSCKNA